jgi:hypothetical protein
MASGRSNLFLAAAALGLMALPACQRPAAVSVAQAAPSSPGGRILVSVAPGAGEHAVVSMLDVRGPMTFGDFVWNDEGVPSGPVWVRIDLSIQLISVFRGGHEIGTAVILYGGNGKPTPAGDFTVLQKAADYHSRTYDAAMPYMVRLTKDGVAIHASNVREGWATHGCIGVPREFAHRLYDAVKLGERVSIA